ncbi:aspartyl protease family protein [Catalinimonas sp. 4WD22]|uniref:aspartyl protease family protein n=1 Tax=Catalinimonas locisalis TaxID=3133978 RepID=UPI0031015745
MITAIQTIFRALCISFALMMISLTVDGAFDSKIFQLRNQKSYTEVRFRLEDNLIIIPVLVNGTEEMSFILDTGTDSPLILNRKYIKNLDLPLNREINFQGAGMGAACKGSVISSMSLQIADAYADHIGGVVLKDNPLMNLRINGIKIHGVLGASLFKSFAVEIDYLTQHLRLHEGQNFLDDQSFSEHEMQMSCSRPILKSVLEFNEKQYELKLMIDTGLSNEMIIYDHTSFDYVKTSVEEIGKGYSGKVKATVAHVDALKIAGQELMDVHTYFPEHHSYKAVLRKVSDRNGTIGNALLKRYCIVLDYAAETIYIREDHKERPDFTKFFAEDVK